MQKDGYRALPFTDPIRLQSHRGSVVQARLPELVHAAATCRRWPGSGLAGVTKGES
jgi:hypothetical protein